ncbi:DUF3617 domain-containing protein [Sphingomonas sp.]|uniref:DUF3617 domain-containing protein n=1 Tax=Sphingomonas sp. TaxID=28214 RepID=UPI00286EAEA1|nr:DUF3617 domain-containing protein [Sphingomonas sp.]
MNHTAFAALLACAIPLAACDSDPEVSATNASVEEVADKVADAGAGTNFIRAGKWSSTVTMEEVTAPGMPPEMAERMKNATGAGQGKTYESCLTEEEAKRPKEDFFAGSNQCRYDHFTMGNGKIDAKMRCAQGGMNQVMEMAGTYSPERYQMRMATKMDGAGGPVEGMTMKMRVDAKRIGACDAKKA